ncbi:sigma-54-dependent transcriptional regulator [Geopsychrobacter electrodiphilus]|uniref:sigma-54-dependent transcriptional regulator n=1 Tax=Geopsychrobacter electrodiphilus TaxID=225196 RepID=UPI00037D03F7|nr:sigma-54 dependent transcriptional regulator [Geopsychrobacter electrodiphilus]
MSIRRILVADDEESIRWVLAKALKKQGFIVDLAEDGLQARQLSRKNHYDLAVLDIKMPGIQGIELLQTLQTESPKTLVVVMTAESTMENAVAAMKNGAYDYLTKPFDLSALDAIILKAEKAAAVTDQIGQLRNEIQDQYRFGRTIIGNSQAMQDVYKILGRVAASDVTVLITGESGTGKELIARAVHYNSPRLGKPFIALNCAAIPRELLESELFGHEKGAFTGAIERKAGKFEQANGGTLFLDEIGDMPLELQAKLLRVLQEKEVTRTGGNSTMAVDVRIVAASNQNLTSMVRDKTFREDLFYRLNVVPIVLPPLRERIEDIQDLAEFFLHRAKQEMGVNVSELSKEAILRLKQHSWPGNIRELENLIKRASLLTPNQVLMPSDFPSLGCTEECGKQEDSLEALVTHKLQNSLAQMNLQELDNLYEMVLHQVERPLINIILQQTRCNQVRTAEILGINRNTLRKKITTLGITVKRTD